MSETLLTNIYSKVAAGASTTLSFRNPAQFRQGVGYAGAQVVPYDGSGIIRISAVAYVTVFPEAFEDPIEYDYHEDLEYEVHIKVPFGAGGPEPEMVYSGNWNRSWRGWPSLELDIHPALWAGVTGSPANQGGNFQIYVILKNNGQHNKQFMMLGTASVIPDVTGPVDSELVAHLEGTITSGAAPPDQTITLGWDHRPSARLAPSALWISGHSHRQGGGVWTGSQISWTLRVFSHAVNTAVPDATAIATFTGDFTGLTKTNNVGFTDKVMTSARAVEEADRFELDLVYVDAGSPHVDYDWKLQLRPI